MEGLLHLHSSTGPIVTLERKAHMGFKGLRMSNNHRLHAICDTRSAPWQNIRVFTTLRGVTNLAAQVSIIAALHHCWSAGH